MPRGKRRSAAEAEEDRHCNKRQRNTNSSRRYSKSEDTSSFSQKRCIAWFREFTSPDDPDTLGPEGMEKFCEDIGVEPENVVMLVLAWKMGARQMGFFTLQEWTKGLTDLQCDTITKLQSKLDYLRSSLNEPITFKSIYRYAYDFARTPEGFLPSAILAVALPSNSVQIFYRYVELRRGLTGRTDRVIQPSLVMALRNIWTELLGNATARDKDQRSMDMDTARAMLQLLLGKHWCLYGQFNSFLEHSKYKVINKDQWCNILEFSRSINNDLSNYDVDGASMQGIPQGAARSARDPDYFLLFPASSITLLPTLIARKKEIHQNPTTLPLCSPRYSKNSKPGPVMLDEFVDWLKVSRSGNLGGS